MVYDPMLEGPNLCHPLQRLRWLSPLKQLLVQLAHLEMKLCVIGSLAKLLPQLFDFGQGFCPLVLNLTCRRRSCGQRQAEQAGTEKSEKQNLKVRLRDFRFTVPFHI